MDVIRESIENACVDFDTREILDDKKLCADTIKVLADAYATVVKADAEKSKIEYAHEEELKKIENQEANDTVNRILQAYKAEAEADIQKMKIESEERIAEDKLEVEKERINNEKDNADYEIDIKAADLEQRRKDKIASDIIAFVGTATTAAVGVAGIVSHRRDLRDILKFEATGEIEHIPVSTAFKTFFKARK